MIKLTPLKLAITIPFMIAGSHAMEPVENESSAFVGQEICVEGEQNTQLETVVISEERVAEVLKYLERNHWGLTLSLSVLENYLLPNSILPNDMKASVLRGIPSATEEEMRCALKGIYSRNRKVDILDCLVLKCKLHHLRLFELESLLDSNTPLPEDIKNMVWKAVPDATEEEMRFQIKTIYWDKKNPSLKLC